MIFDNYPYTNFHEMNDDWIIKTLRKFGERLDEFVTMNSLTYADPIQYDPDTIYPVNTVVIYNDTAYVSKQTIPAGVLPTVEGEFWLEIFPFGDLINAQVNVGLAEIDRYLQQASDEIAAAIGAIPTTVNNWMDSHPDVTTTLQDGAVSWLKLNNNLQSVLMAGFDVSTAVQIIDFEQGAIGITNGENVESTFMCRTGFHQIPAGITMIRTIEGFRIQVFRYNLDGTFVDRVLEVVRTTWEPFVTDANHKYRVSISYEDYSTLTPTDLPALPAPCFPYVQSLPNGAVTLEKLSDSLAELLVFDPFDDNSWAAGYLGTVRIHPGSSNNDVYNTSPVRVGKGDVIEVKLGIPTNATSTYFYYAWCNEDGTYNTRNAAPSNGRYNESDGNYRYYHTTLTAPADGYFIMSYRQVGATYGTYEGISYVKIARLAVNNFKFNALLESWANFADTNLTALNSADEEDAKFRFPSVQDMPIDVLHRGLATAGMPENVIVSFKDGILNGWRYLETDIRKTLDGVWVLLHDATINRTARNADGTTISTTINIANITYAEALEYDFGIYAGAEYAGTKIPTLDEFLNLCNKAHVYPVIEVKDSSISDADVSAVWALFEKYDMTQRVILLCSSLGGVDKFTAINPYIPVINTSSSEWTYVDPSTFPTLDPPYAASYKTGKNKVFHEHEASAFATLADMENFIDYYRYFGIYPGIYCPTTVAGIENLSDRLSMVTTQYYKYSDVKADLDD